MENWRTLGGNLTYLLTGAPPVSDTTVIVDGSATVPAPTPTHIGIVGEIKHLLGDAHDAIFAVEARVAAALSSPVAHSIELAIEPAVVTLAEALLPAGLPVLEASLAGLLPAQFGAELLAKFGPVVTSYVLGYLARLPHVNVAPAPPPENPGA